MDISIWPTWVYISLPCRLQWWKLTPYQSLINLVTLKCKQGFVSLMLRLSIHKPVWCSISIIEISTLPRWLHCLELVVSGHLPYIPDFQQLVFRVWCYIQAVPFWAHICDAFSMPYKDTNRSVAWEWSPVPHFDKGVIRAWQENIWMLPICPTNRIDLIRMTVVNTSGNPVRYKIIANNLATLCTCHNFLTVARVLRWHNCASTTVIPIILC